MSSQLPPQGTPLATSESQQNLRLLELPPELMDMVSAPNPPRLYFKSLSPRTADVGVGRSVASSPDSKAARHLHLCTGTQSYQVRQISTSNSVYVLEPSSIMHHAPRDGNGDESMLASEATAQPSSIMTAIAKVDTMLELLPVSHDVKPMLKRLLPVYDLSNALSAEEMRLHFLSHSTSASKEQLLADLPTPDSQSEQGWRDLLAFEAEGRCARPSTSVLLSVWRSIIDNATLNRLDLTQDVDVNVTKFFEKEHAASVHAAAAPPLAEAIFRHLENLTVSDGTATSLQFDRLKSVRWTGQILLEAHAERSAPESFSLTDYVCQWQDLLPERWREDAALDKLPEASYTATTLDGQVTIAWNGTDDSASLPPEPAASEATKMTAGKRKWHEKFKAQRKEMKK